MIKGEDRTSRWGRAEVHKAVARFVVALLIYSGFAVYLYRPHFKGFDRWQYLLVVNASVASLGCYLLSRRWVAGFFESFLAGAIYGFGPLALGLAKFHPTAGFLVAAIPWLFCPAAFGPRARWRLLRIPLAALPLLVIILFFQVSARFGLYPIPIRLKLEFADLTGILAPTIAAKRHTTLTGFYHVPIAPLIMGVAVFLAPLKLLFTGGVAQRVRSTAALAIRRFGIIAIFAAATVLAFCDSYLDISPIIFFAISTLCCSILAGAGMQALVAAGPADRRWLLLTSIVMGILAVVALLLATKYFQSFLGIADAYGLLLTEAAKMYLLGAIALAILFFMARAKLRLRPIRLALLWAPMAIDFFLGATEIVDKTL
ncbi:MAG: hypothetical protein AMJ65_10710 [Phycisphaerae bacterium SG8_4]|nr:MAG: hypothetical protein AMJ65_10710 [Phycisphaerae bacterium SG8_4]